MNWFVVAVRRALSLTWGHRWLFGVPVATLLVAATLYAVRMPDTYEAKAIVMVADFSPGDTSSTLPGERSSQPYATVVTARDRVICQETVRAIIPIIMPTEDPSNPRVLEAGRKRISYDQTSDYSFQVGITSVYPERASLAVNTLLESFLELERQAPLRRAEARLAFYDKESKAVEATFKKEVEALNAFRLEHAETLPAAKDAIHQEISSVRTELSMHEQLSSSARRRAEFLTEQLTRLRVDQPDGSDRSSTAEEKRLEHRLNLEQSRLMDARKRMAELRRKYTDKWPAIIDLKKEIRSLESDAQATVAALEAAREAADQRASRAKAKVGQNSLAVLESHRAEAERESEAALKAAQALRTRMDALQDRLARMPLTEAQLVPLLQAVEDADKLRTEYQREAKRAAEQATFYRNSDASDVTPFNVAEWAVVPSRPSGPKRMRYLLTAIAVGGMIGYGLVVLRRKFGEEAVTSSADLAALLPGAMIVTVPLLPDGRGGASAALAAREIVLGAWVLGCILLSALAIAAHRGLIEAPRWLGGLLGGGA